MNGIKQKQSRIFILLLLLGCFSCKEDDFLTTKEEPILGMTGIRDIQCGAQAEQIDYSIYKMSSDGTRVGDMAPLFDEASGNFIIYHLKDIWNDATNQRHPWYAFTTNNFFNFSETGEIISASSQNCDQDFAIGAGSVIESGGKFYGFYTGHNPNSGACGTKKEGIMLATSMSPTQGFVKDNTFTTINVPLGQGFDENDNFRDPYIFLDNGTYYMLISARKNISGVMKGVIAKYTSTNLKNWKYKGIMYDGGTDNYWMMECAEIFKSGGYYYLLYSDQINKYVYYRKSTSVNGPWTKPEGPDRFEGKGIFAAKTAIDSYGDRYIFGWNNILSGNTDTGSWMWGGNLVVHKIYPRPNGDLAVTIPHTLKNYLETNIYDPGIESQWGNVTNTNSGTHSYRLVSNANFDVANVIFNPVNEERYKISATVNFSGSQKDFGFMIGACDGYNDFYSLRFIPSQNRFSFDKQNRSSLTTTTVAENDVPISLMPNTDYNIDIVIENSMVVVYINNLVALTNRIYKAPATSWGIFSDFSDVTFRNIRVTHP